MGIFKHLKKHSCRMYAWYHHGLPMTLTQRYILSQRNFELLPQLGGALFVKSRIWAALWLPLARRTQQTWCCGISELEPHLSLQRLCGILPSWTSAFAMRTNQANSLEDPGFCAAESAWSGYPSHDPRRVMWSSHVQPSCLLGLRLTTGAIVWPW